MIALLALTILGQDGLATLNTGFARTYKDADGKEVRMFVKERVEIDGKPCYVLIHEGFEGDLASMVVEPKSDGWVVRRFERNISEPFYWVKWPLKEGLKWEASVDAGRFKKEKTTLTFEVKGEEEVKTPAGKFTAWKVCFKYASSEQTVEGAYWMAKIVGEVKREAKIGKGEKTKVVCFELFKLRDWGDMKANEQCARGSLRQFSSCEITFKTTDADRNGVSDYWVLDVAGLYRVALNNDATQQAGALIQASMAGADAKPCPAPKGVNYSSTAELKEFEPLSGYWFKAIPNYEDAAGKKVAYHNGDGRSIGRFGFAAYPAEYDRSGKMTYILNEAGTVFQKDTGGEPIEVFPADPIKEGWKVVQ